MNSSAIYNFLHFTKKIVSKIYHVYYPQYQDEEDLTFAEIKPFLMPSSTSASASPASAAAASADMFAPVEKIEYIKKDKTFTSYLFDPEHSGRCHNRITMNAAMVFVSLAEISEFTFVLGTLTFVLQPSGTYLGQKTYSCLVAELKSVPAMVSVVEALRDLKFSDSAPKLDNFTFQLKEQVTGTTHTFNGRTSNDMEKPFHSDVNNH